MKTYKGLLCVIMATRMLLAEKIETPTIQTQPPVSENPASSDSLLELEKKVVASAMTGETEVIVSPKNSTPNVDSDEFSSVAGFENEIETIEMAESVEADSSDNSTFASAQKLFNDMWGEKKTRSPSAPKKPTVLPTKEANPSITSAQITTTPPPNDLIPFTQTKVYADNPVAGPDVKLPPMPDTLLPMGKPKLVAVSPKVKPKPEIPAVTEPPKMQNSSEKNSETEQENSSHQAHLKQKTDEAQVTVSPFVQWIRENQKSPEIAQEVYDQYKSNEAQKNSLKSDDVFIKVRFPYSGAQSAPPSGGAVIYTTPQK